MKKYGNYYRYNIALNDDEQEKFLILQNKRIGAKKIFKKGMEELIRLQVLDYPKPTTEEG